MLRLMKIWTGYRLHELHKLLLYLEESFGLLSGQFASSAADQFQKTILCGTGCAFDLAVGPAASIGFVLACDVHRYPAPS